MKNTIKDYLLNNMEVTRDLVFELNSWNSCLDYLDACDMDYLDDYLDGFTASEIANKIFYGDFNPNHDYFRFNVYNNLESFDAYYLQELYEDYIDEIVEALLYHINDISIYDDELKDLIEAYEENN